jgi:hypothetical protein
MDDMNTHIHTLPYRYLGLDHLQLRQQLPHAHRHDLLGAQAARGLYAKVEVLSKSVCVEWCE